eukprot:TRINITY_DN7346_c0_g2_i1.p1 TRINITY_DN7346_c0_g2~~TRINITY_DN7346_c0_g2_i1.p1  ORF type:complete len:646 (+),score=230.18 TRINITY_DN7346_c0_g2_i1:48-1940(+)
MRLLRAAQPGRGWLHVSLRPHAAPGLSQRRLVTAQAQAQGEKKKGSKGRIPFSTIHKDDLSDPTWRERVAGSPYAFMALMAMLYILSLYDDFRFGILRGLGRVWTVFQQVVSISTYYNIMYYSCATDLEWNEVISRCHETAAHHLLGHMLNLGGIYVKIGQLMSTMTVSLPLEWCITMQACLDNAQAMAPMSVMSVMGSSIDEGGLGASQAALEGFEFFPIRAASIAQVHLARHSTTQERVAVKVQYKNIPLMMTVDFAVLRLAAWVVSLDTGCDLTWLVDHMYKGIQEELNFVQEGVNCARFREMFASWEKVSAPRVFNDLSAGRVLTMEFIDGFNINMAERLDVLGIDKQEVSDLLGRVIASSIFEHGLLHADPHPANVFVEPLNNTHIYGIDADRERNPHHVVNGFLQDKAATFKEFSLVTGDLWNFAITDDKPEEKDVLVQIPYALPELKDGPTKWRLQMLDHGSYQRLSPGFRQDYAELWCGIGLRDRGMIEAACDGLGVTNKKLLATILLGDGATKILGTSPSSAELSRDDFLLPHVSHTNMALGMLEVMGELPPDMVLVMKCQSLLRSITSDLGAQSTYERTMAEQAARYLTKLRVQGASDASEVRAARAAEHAMLQRMQSFS